MMTNVILDVLFTHVTIIKYSYLLTCISNIDLINGTRERNQYLLAVFLPYQLLGFPCRLESLGKLVNLTKLSLSAVLSSHLESKSLYFMQYSHLESESLY